MRDYETAYAICVHTAVLKTFLKRSGPPIGRSRYVSINLWPRMRTTSVYSQQAPLGTERSLFSAEKTNEGKKAVNRKTPGNGYRVQKGNRLSFHGRWYTCPGLLSRLQGREFDLYYDKRDVGVLYIFVDGEYVGEAYCPQLMGGRVSEWEARAMRKHDEEQAKIAREQALPVRARMETRSGSSSPPPKY